MGIVRRVAKNSIVIFAGEVIIRIISFFTTLILVRYLGSSDFGKYSLVYAFLSFFQVFMNMGMEPIIVRELSKDSGKSAQLLGNAITLQFFFSMIGLFLCWIILQWMHYPADIKILIYLASLNMIFSFGLLFNNIFQAKLLMKYPTVITIVMKILLITFTYLLIFLKAKLFHFVLINILIFIIQIIFVYFQARKIIPIRVKIDLKIWKELVFNSWPLVISIIFVSFYTRMDQILLFHIKGKEQLGLYAAAVKLAELPLVVAGAFMSSVFPLFSKYALDSSDLFKRIYEVSSKYLMIFIIPIAMMTTLYSKQIIIICYGENFVSSHAVLAILIWLTVFVYASIIRSNLLIAKNLQYLDIIFTGFLMTINIILNLILIPKYSFVGAALASTISLALTIPLSYLLRKTRVFALAIIKSMIKPFLAAFIAGYSVHLFSNLHLVFNFILSGFIYLFLLLSIRAIDTQDIRYGKEILTKI